MDIFAGGITFEANIVLRKKTTFGECVSQIVKTTLEANLDISGECVSPIALRKKTTFGLLTCVLLTIFQAFFGTVQRSHFSFVAKKTIFFFPLQSKETKCRLFVFFLANFFLKAKFKTKC